MSRMIRFAALFSLIVPLPAGAAVTCVDVLRTLGSSLADVNCFASDDLTTNNPLTTPANNSLPGLPAFAFTPITDRSVIAPSAGKRTPITKAVPGIQLDARIASDPQGQARFLLRLPNDWNGRLVVAGASGTRSEFNGDFAWSDYVVQKGYAYASQNKGVLNFIQFTTAADPLACRLNPASPVFVHFYDNDPGQPFTRWAEFMVKAAELARDGVRRAMAVRRVHLRGGDLERRLPGTARGRDRAEAFRRRRRLGRHLRRRARAEYPHRPAAGDPEFPGLRRLGPQPREHRGEEHPGRGLSARHRRAGAPSLWGLYNAQFWEVTQCQWQKRLDPTYNTYVSGTGTYNYVSRLSFSDVGAQFAAFATTGDIQRPLITVAGTMDALLPIDHHARAYARKIAAVAESQWRGRAGGNDKQRPRIASTKCRTETISKLSRTCSRSSN